MRSSLMTIRELSSFLHVHPQTVYKWTREGRIPFFHVQGKVRFDRADIEAEIEKARIRSPFDFLPRLELSLDRYDKLYLKGGGKALRKKDARRWNYHCLGSVYQRGKRWHIDYRVLGKRRREAVRSARTRGEAVLVLQQKIAEAFNGLYNPKRKPEPIKFSELAERYLSDYAKPKKRSWKTDKYYIESSPCSGITSMKDFFGEKLLTSIGSHDVEKYIKARLEEGVSAITVNRCLQILRRMFNLAVDWGLTTVNPLRNIKLFSEKNNLKERILTLEEEERLMAASSEHMKLIIAVALNSGLRRGEILSLRWSDIDFKSRILKVKRSKGGTAGSINMNRTLFETLKDLRLMSQASEHVFLNPRTEKPFVEIGKAFRAACRRAGVQNLRFHDLRHTFASRLIATGADIVTVRDLLGHSSVRLTERYTHSRDEQKRRAVELLDRQKSEKESQNGHKIEKAENRVLATFLFSVN